MKASELIQELSNIISNKGDMEIIIFDTLAGTPLFDICEIREIGSSEKENIVIRCC